MSKYIYNKDYFKKVDSEYKAYWLGFLYADGCITRYYKNEKLKSMNLELTLCEKDKEHLLKLNKCLSSNVPIKKRKVLLNNKTFYSYRLTIYCTKMCYDLIDLGCIPAKTYSIKFPSYDIVPKIYMKDFIRGYFDGDGCICTTLMNNTPHIVTNMTGMPDMLKSISDFLISEKIIRVNPKIYKDKRSKAHSVYFYGTDSNKDFLDYLYKDSNIYLDRKYIKYTEFYDGYDYNSNKRGVYYDKNHNTYIVTISINNNRRIIARCKTQKEAIEIRKQAEIDKMNKLKLPT